MKISALPLLAALGVFGFAGAFVWAAVRPITPDAAEADGKMPTANVSEVISDGLLDMQVFVLDDLGVRLELRFAANSGAVSAARTSPDVNLAMLDMHMDGLDPTLEPTGPGAWRARFQLPMAGRWVISAGFAEERAEVEFDAR